MILVHPTLFLQTQGLLSVSLKRGQAEGDLHTFLYVSLFPFPCVTVIFVYMCSNPRKGSWLVGGHVGLVAGHEDQCVLM